MLEREPWDIATGNCISRGEETLMLERAYIAAGSYRIKRQEQTCALQAGEKDEDIESATPSLAEHKWK